MPEQDKNKPGDEKKYNERLDKLHNSTKGLAKTIAKTSFGDTIKEFDDDYVSPEEEQSANTIRENNRTNIFEITNNRGQVVYLDIDRARNRLKNKISVWRSKLKNTNIIVDGVSIPTKEKTQKKIDEIVDQIDSAKSVDEIANILVENRIML